MLRPYQEKTLEEINTHLDNGCKSILVYAPTGAGKTIMMSHIGLKFLRLRKKVLYIVNATVLIEQTASKLTHLGIRTSFIKAGKKFDPTCPCQIASIQTLNRRKVFPEADLVCIDEAHASKSVSYQPIFDVYSNVPIIGFTATPQRTSKKETLADLFNCLVVSTKIQDLIQQGYLCPFEIYSVPQKDIKEKLKNVRVVAGDYNQSDLSVVMNDVTSNRNAVLEWLNKAEGRPTIAFAVDIDHATALHQEFVNHEVSARLILGTTPQEYRLKYFDELRLGSTQVLVSIDVLTEGFDAPWVSCVIQQRPTKSTIVQIQQIGRGLRTWAGKENCIILDGVANVFQTVHPLAYDPEQAFYKTPKEGNGDAPFKVCGTCDAVNHAAATVCQVCGTPFPPKPVIDVEPEHESLEKVLFNPTWGLRTELTFIPTKDATKAVKRFRSMIKKAYKQGKDLALAYADYEVLYGILPPIGVTYGALFGPKPTNQQVLEFVRYLATFQGVKSEAQLAELFRREFNIFPPNYQHPKEYYNSKTPKV